MSELERLIAAAVKEAIKEVGFDRIRSEEFFGAKQREGPGAAIHGHPRGS